MVLVAEQYGKNGFREVEKYMIILCITRLMNIKRMSRDNHSNIATKV